MPEVTYPALWFWFNVAQFVFTGLVAIYARKLAKDKAVNKRFETIEKDLSGRIKAEDLDPRCAAHLKRTAAIEASTAEIHVELRHLPAQQQFDLLNRSIGDLNGSLQKTQGRLDGLNRAVDLINEFLIQQGGEKTR